MATEGGGFMHEHPWMTFVLGYMAIRTVGRMIDRPSSAPASTRSSLPAVAVAGMMTGDEVLFLDSSQRQHPTPASSVDRQPDDIAPASPALVKFGPIGYRAFTGRLLEMVTPMGGTLMAPGLESSDHSILAPALLPNGERGFLAQQNGTATVHARYDFGDGFPYDASVAVEVIGG